MKSISLKNFQCFKDSQEIPIHNLTIFVGENDSGKSAILKALDIFFGNIPPTTEIFHKIGNSFQKECEIQVTFSISTKNEDEFPKQFVVD